MVITPRASAASDLSLPARDIMSRTPSWILRSGSSILAGATVLLLLLAWMIHSPDVIEGHIMVTGLNPPVSLVARQSGLLEDLSVKEKQQVRRGDLLGVIQNPAASARVFWLREQVAKLEPFLTDPDLFVTLELGAETRLGAVQPAYSDFFTHYRNYQTLLADKHATQTFAVLQQQLERKKSQLASARQQRENAQRETDLARENFQRMKKLHRGEAISTAELQNQERVMLEQERQFSSASRALTEEEIAAGNYEKQMRDLTHERTESLRLARLALTEAVKKFLAAVEAWENDYVFRAPIDGAVAFYDFWAGQQFVAAGKTVFIISPESPVLVGRLPVKQGGAGKIKPGQTVRIEFDDYPDREFGLVTGKVRSISLVTQHGEHLVSIEVPFPLISHFGRTLPFKQEMTGVARIITDDRRLISRLFDQIRRAVQGTSAS